MTYINYDFEKMEDWFLISKLNTLCIEKRTGNFDENSLRAMLAIQSELNKRAGENLQKYLDREKTPT